MEQLLKDVTAIVEAARFEKDSLWFHIHGELGVPWKQNRSGLGVQVGTLSDMPVFISLTTATVDGKKILFVEATSSVVDWRMIHGWLDEKLPGIPRTDASNFHTVLL